MLVYHRANISICLELIHLEHLFAIQTSLSWLLHLLHLIGWCRVHQSLQLTGLRALYFEFAGFLQFLLGAMGVRRSEIVPGCL